MNPYIVGVEQVLLRKNEHLKRIINALVERLGGTVDLSSDTYNRLRKNRTMKNILLKLWRDECGLVVTSELVAELGITLTDPKDFR